MKIYWQESLTSFVISFYFRYYYEIFLERLKKRMKTVMQNNGHPDVYEPRTPE